MAKASSSFARIWANASLEDGRFSGGVDDTSLPPVSSCCAPLLASSAVVELPAGAMVLDALEWCAALRVDTMAAMAAHCRSPGPFSAAALDEGEQALVGRMIERVEGLAALAEQTQRVRNGAGALAAGGEARAIWEQRAAWLHEEVLALAAETLQPSGEAVSPSPTLRPSSRGALDPAGRP